MRVRVQKYVFSLLLLWVASLAVSAQSPHKYSCEFGVQAGVGYYVGEGASYVMTPSTIREAFGAQFRYKIDDRWALQAKGMFHHTAGNVCDPLQGWASTGDKWENKMINIDLCAEFNFFRFGPKCLDTRVKQFTPYMLVGVGCSMYNGASVAAGDIYKPTGGDFRQCAMYLPVGLGLKWKFSEHCGLNLAWQHNVYLLGRGMNADTPGADNLEGVAEMDNYGLTNGRNFLMNDRTGQLTLGIVFEFVLQKRKCVMCKHK